MGLLKEELLNNKKDIQNKVDDEQNYANDETTSSGFLTTPEDKTVSSIWKNLSISNKRKKKYKLVEKMYDLDEIASSQIDNIASASTTNGVSVKVKDADPEDESKLETQAKKIIDDLIDRLKLNQGDNGCQMTAKRAILFGDDFYEAVVDLNTMDIVGWEERPRETMVRKENYNGDLKKFEQYEDITRQTDPLVEYEPWQIFHFRWNRIKGKYGRSILMSQRSTFKKLQMMEKDMVVRRRTRAGQKLHHKPNLEATKGKPLSRDQIVEHMKLNSTKKHTVRTNFYSNGLWDIEVLQGDNTLDKIDDILYFQEKQFIGGKVPKGLLASGQDINRAVLDRQDIGYSRILNDVQEMLEEQYLELFQLQLIIKGIDYDKIKIEFDWGDKNNQDLNDKIDLAIKLFDKAPEASIPVQYIVEELFGVEWSKAKEQHRRYAEHIAKVNEIMIDGSNVFKTSHRTQDTVQNAADAANNDDERNEENKEDLWI